MSDDLEDDEADSVAHRTRSGGKRGAVGGGRARARAQRDRQGGTHQPPGTSTGQGFKPT